MARALPPTAPCDFGSRRPGRRAERDSIATPTAECSLQPKALVLRRLSVQVVCLAIGVSLLAAPATAGSLRGFSPLKLWRQHFAQIHRSWWPASANQGGKRIWLGRPLGALFHRLLRLDLGAEGSLRLVDHHVTFQKGELTLEADIDVDVADQLRRYATQELSANHLTLLDEIRDVLAYEAELPPLQRGHQVLFKPGPAAVSAIEVKPVASLEFERARHTALETPEGIVLLKAESADTALAEFHAHRAAEIRGDKPEAYRVVVGNRALAEADAVLAAAAFPPRLTEFLRGIFVVGMIRGQVTLETARTFRGIRMVANLRAGGWNLGVRRTDNGLRFMATHVPGGRSWLPGGTLALERALTGLDHHSLPEFDLGPDGDLLPEQPAQAQSRRAR